ncbi:MAG: MFS transporter [Candidatus Parcubacteria bacterium]|nr:MFS transporter [Candidatus Parcubacteria bacterium]
MSPRVILFFANFFLSVLTALSVYVLLPFLSTLMPIAYTGLVVAGGGLAAIILFPFMPRLVARYGAQKLALIFAFVEMVTLFVLAAAPGAVASVLLVITMIMVQPFVSYELDLLLEATGAKEGSTGRVRTAFLTAWNIGGFITPLLIGALLANSDVYGRVFIAAAAAAIPFIVLFATRRLPSGEVPQPSHMKDTLTCILHNRDLAAVSAGHIILWFFYVWAPLYIPIYLHSVLGFSWMDLGWIFSLMLIPYVLIEYPAGWVADRFIGDKELMLAGFLVAGSALASISLLKSSSSLILILCILIISRCGAALIESMTEGHFFRRVSEKDINSVSFFRAAWPLAYIIAPLIGSTILFFGSYQLFFIITGAFVAIAGSIATLLVKDFR